MLSSIPFLSTVSAMSGFFYRLVFLLFCEFLDPTPRRGVVEVIPYQKATKTNSAETARMVYRKSLVSNRVPTTGQCIGMKKVNKSVMMNSTRSRTHRKILYRLAIHQAGKVYNRSE